MLAAVGEDLARRVRIRLVPFGDDHIRLGHREAHRVRRGDDCRLGDGVVFDEHTLELERGEPVVAGLEHVIGASDVGDEAVLITFGHVTGVVDAAFESLGGLLLIAPVAARQAQRPGIEAEADLSLIALFPGGRVDEDDVVSGQHLAHRAVLELLIGGIADLQGRLGLPVAVADEHAPIVLHPVDDLRVEGLTGTEGDRRRVLQVTEIRLDEHPPHGRRGAEARHADPVHGLHQRIRVEACVVVEEHAGLGDPRGEDVRPCVLRPARRGDVEMDVSGLQAHPVHRREMSNGVGDMRMGDHLRLRRRARGEVKEEEIVGAGPALRIEVGGFLIGFGVGAVLLTRGLTTDDDADHLGVDVIELRGIRDAGDDEFCLAAFHPVAQIDRPELSRRRQQHRTELDAGEHRLPEFHLVAEHHHHMITAFDSGSAQEVRDLIRTGRELGVAPLALGAVLLDDPQSRTVIVLRHPVEPVEAEVEVFEAGPFETRTRGLIVAAKLDQRVPGRPEIVGHRHCDLLTFSSTAPHVTPSTDSSETEAISTA